MKKLFLAAVGFALGFLVIYGTYAQTPEENGVQSLGISASSGNVAAATATATLPATANRTTFLCGFLVTGLGATAGSSPLGSVSNLNNTLNFDVGVPAGVTVPLPQVEVNFTECLPANAPNTSIAVAVPSFGAGNTNASVMAWGYWQ